MSNKYIEVEIPADDPKPQATTRDSQILGAQARIHREIKQTQAALAAQKELIPYSPYKHGNEVLRLEQKLRDLAGQYQALNAEKRTHDDYVRSNGGVFSSSNG